jgi:hypothetical protein
VVCEPTPEKPGKFNVAHFLTHLMAGNYTASNLNTLEKLCKKVEVSKKLFLYYDPLLQKPLTTDSISQAVCDKLVCHLLLAFIYSGNYKFCNSLLKILDGILIIPIYQISDQLKSLCEEILYVMLATA